MDQIQELAGGMTNKVYLLKGQNLLRLFGPSNDTLINVDQERSYIILIKM